MLRSVVNLARRANHVRRPGLREDLAQFERETSREYYALKAVRDVRSVEYHPEVIDRQNLAESILILKQQKVAAILIALVGRLAHLGHQPLTSFPMAGNVQEFGLLKERLLEVENGRWRIPIIDILARLGQEPFEVLELLTMRDCPINLLVGRHFDPQVPRRREQERDVNDGLVAEQVDFLVRFLGPVTRRHDGLLA